MMLEKMVAGFLRGLLILWLLLSFLYIGNLIIKVNWVGVAKLKPGDLIANSNDFFTRELFSHQGF